MASQISGREVTRIVVDDERWIANKVAAGTPEAMARMTLTTFQAAHEGRFAGVDPLLAELLGREPRSVVDQLGDSIAAQRVRPTHCAAYRTLCRCPQRQATPGGQPMARLGNGLCLSAAMSRCGGWILGVAF
jgi:hypothetical protein